MNNLAEVYKLTGNKDSALKYVELSHAIKDSIFTAEKNKEIQNITFNERLKEQEIKADQLKYKNRVQLYALAAGIFILLFIAGIFWRNSRQQQKAKNKIEKAYGELKNTQTQLIQSEKMASLGELTAGIAHEIQNPLNFVNNFSEVNAELIDELRNQLKSGNTSDALSISNDIMDNEQKIIHHGKRADTVVKGMLQHSRTSTGQKEPTDINELAHEYLKLSYHGIRAKDKSFNATIKTNFDESIGKINIVPQDIGRVLLNMFNNAFYAVSNHTPQPPKGGVKFEPCVSVSTRLINPPSGGLGGGLEIRISDNGSGIAPKNLDKIFQPFFTTKPPGRGTGLGLSISYDIIKGHGGEIKVDTKEGEFATFIIILPVNQT
jgi:signal transduction histidine kinase